MSANKILIQSTIDNEIKTINPVDNSFKTLQSQTEQDFINYGMDLSTLTSIDYDANYTKKSYVQKSNTPLGNGKIFTQPIDLLKYKVKKTSLYDGSQYSGVNKILIQLSNGEYKIYDLTTSSWQTVTTISPTETDFLTYGMDESFVSTIPESAWKMLGYQVNIVKYTDNLSQNESTVTIETEPFTFYDEMGDSINILYYTDNTSKTSADLEITANYSPLDEIDEDFEVVTWTNESIKNIGVNALPIQQFIVNPTDLQLYGDLQQIIATKITPTLSEGILRFVISFDSGTTWLSYNYDAWYNVDISKLDNIKKYGMTLDEINGIPTSKLSEKSTGQVKIGYYLEERAHRNEELKIDEVKVVSKQPLNDMKISDLAFYILNTTATINLTFVGNKISGKLDDADAGKVRYRVFLNNQPYYPIDGSFTPLRPSPVDINIVIDDNKTRFGQQNSLVVEFQDYWGQTDSWSTTFIGTYTGLMFMDESGNYYSDSFSGLLKYLDFGQIIAGQTSLDQKVILRNQLGYDIQNIMLEVVQPLTSGVIVELSKQQSPFIASTSLVYPEVLNTSGEIEFFVRIASQVTATPTANGTFGIRVKADKVN